MKALVSLEPEKRRNLLILFTAGLSFWLSMTSLLPVLPAYIEDVGGTTQQVGLVMGCFAIGLLLSRTWLGWIADRRSRKLVLLIGTAVAGIAPLGYLLVHSITVLMAIRAFHGISLAAFTTGYSALIVDLSPAKQRGELIGYMSLAVPIGMALGPALGGFLQAYAGYAPLFLLSASWGFLALILASKVREATREEALLDNQGDFSQPNRSFWQLIRDPSLVVPAVILLLIGLLFGTLRAFLPLFIREMEIDFNAGLFYAAAAIASFSVRIFAGRVSDLIGRGALIAGSLVCHGLSMVLLAWAETPSVLIAAAVAEGAGSGLLLPMILALISDRSYAHERGQVYSLCIGGFDLGIAIAGPALGTLAVVLSYREMFALSAGLAVLALLIFLTQSNKDLARSLRFALGREKDLYALD